MSFSALVACFHSGNAKDYLVFPEFLDALHRAQIRVIPYLDLVLAIRQYRTHELPEKVCCLTFDDGQDMDFVDVEHPVHGAQASFARSMREALTRHQTHDSSYQLHATSFVIASPLARAQIQVKEMLGYPWMSDRWWNPAIASGMFHIASHSYDHLSPSADPVCQKDGKRADFHAVDNLEDAHAQIRKAREVIEFIAPNPAVKLGQALFAYPFGHHNAYLREDYFPNQIHEHGTIAACTIEPELTHAHSNLFALPRFVFGFDWHDPSELPLLRGA